MQAQSVGVQFDQLEPRRGGGARGRARQSCEGRVDHLQRAAGVVVSVRTVRYAGFRLWLSRTIVLVDVGRSERLSYHSTHIPILRIYFSDTCNLTRKAGLFAKCPFMASQLL
jgi:hypothetical protein